MLKERSFRWNEAKDKIGTGNTVFFFNHALALRVVFQPKISFGENTLTNLRIRK